MITEADMDRYGFTGDYEDLIEYEIVKSFSMGDYEGDYTFHLTDKMGRHGFLVVGYGSCSHCDALQACVTLADVQRLQEEILNDIRWFYSLTELGDWARTYDFKGQWYYYDSQSEEAINYFRALSS